MGIYIYRHRTFCAELDHNINNELRDVFTQDAAVWSDEYAAWREAAHAGLRAHFARGAEVAEEQEITAQQQPTKTAGERDAKEVVMNVPHAVKTTKRWLSDNIPVLACTAGLVAAAQDAVNVFGRGTLEESAAMISALHQSTHGDMDALETIAGDTLDYAAATPTEIIAAHLILAAFAASIDAVAWGDAPAAAAAAA